VSCLIWPFHDNTALAKREAAESTVVTGGSVAAATGPPVGTIEIDIAILRQNRLDSYGAESLFADSTFS
jgi:hypothetical protein